MEGGLVGVRVGADLLLEMAVQTIEGDDGVAVGVVEVAPDAVVRSGGCLVADSDAV